MAAVQQGGTVLGQGVEAASSKTKREKLGMTVARARHPLLAPLRGMRTMVDHCERDEVVDKEAKQSWTQDVEPRKESRRKFTGVRSLEDIRHEAVGPRRLRQQWKEGADNSGSNEVRPS